MLENNIKSYTLFTHKNKQIVFAYERFGYNPLLRTKPGIFWFGFGYFGDYRLFYWNHFVGVRLFGRELIFWRYKLYEYLGYKHGYTTFYNTILNNKKCKNEPR